MWSSISKTFASNINANYKVSDVPASSGGPWRIYDAKNKTTNKQASVFVFDRKSLEHAAGGLESRSRAGALKRVQDEVAERLKREAAALARLRHPSILELVEPVEETRSGGVQFATEPITASLSALLLDKDEQERSGGPGGRRSRFVVDDPDGGGKKRREIEIDELELQKGLLQIGKGLEFLHESAGLVHANLTPDAIFINSKGDWKISGLGFSGRSEGFTGATSAAPIALSELLNFDQRLPRFSQLNLDYCSPDFVLDKHATVAADMFSLGLLIVALYNSPHQSPLETNMSISTYKRLFSTASIMPSQTNNFLSSTPLPRPVSNLLGRLITRRPAQRMNAREFQEAEFFDNILVNTIRFLDSLPAKTPNEKSQFLRGFPRIMNQFPKTVLEKKVFPALLEEMKDRELIALILQNVFKLVVLMPGSRRAVAEKLLPRLREIYSSAGKNQDRDTAKEAGLMVVLENMPTIAERTNGKEFKDDVWPIIQLSMESPTHSLVDAAIGTLPAIMSALDFSTIKNDVFPVVANVFSKTSSLGIKIRGLEALQLLCGGTFGGDSDVGDGLDGFDASSGAKKKQQSVILDKYTIQEKVVPLMKAIKTKEPAVMMAALNVFREIGKIADSDFLAMDVLPLLWHMSLGPLLNLAQFKSYITLIKSISERIEQEQTRKLQEMGASTVSADRSALMSGLNGRNSKGLAESSGDQGDFEALVLGRSRPGQSQTESFDAWTEPAKAPSQLNTNSQPATFAWSTLSPQTGSALRPTKSQASRTVTPDLSMSAFAPLQPSGPSIGNTTTQPMRPLQPLDVSSTSFATRQNGGAIDWSTATSSTAGWTSNAAATHSSTSSSLWSQPMSPSTNSTFSQPNSAAFTISPPPRSPYQNFSIAPPQGSGGMGQAGRAGAVAPPAQQPGQKQGIDKYDSLL